MPPYYSWYKVNYNNAAELEWGRNLGCDFVKRSCYDWMQTRQSRLLVSLLWCLSGFSFILIFATNVRVTLIMKIQNFLVLSKIWYFYLNSDTKVNFRVYTHQGNVREFEIFQGQGISCCVRENWNCLNVRELSENFTFQSWSEGNEAVVFFVVVFFLR